MTAKMMLVCRVFQSMGFYSKHGKLTRLLFRFSLLLLICIVATMWLSSGRKSASYIGQHLFWTRSSNSSKLERVLTMVKLQPDYKPDAANLALLRNGSVRCRDVQSLFPNRIPPVIHWTNADQRVLKKHHKMLRSWRKVLGDSFAYMYWEDKDINKLLDMHYQSLRPFYQKLKAGIMRSDIGRLIILHHVGGVYSDLDVNLLRNITSFLLQYSAVWSQEPIEHIYYMYKRTQLLSNALFMTQARHKFLEYVLNAWPPWFQSQWSKKTGTLGDPNKAIHITGPLMLNYFFDKCSKSNSSQADCGELHLADPDQFQPIWDSGYAQNIAKNQCSKHRKTMKPVQIKHCDLLASRKFEMRPINRNVTYGVHRFLHTSYRVKYSFDKSKLAKDILPLSHCII
ncbi:hypothetical protein BOX15_Mlig025869g2 [Macrostomum lignano]|uniref:Uncharacterized protein n=1 Tax=Macrostomum lignano TaxID=282301 RepID=A0A267GFK6_9PLAT|nr:hypothetical protein BOX15_Mlig025869g3 [Macrostomum lignano]PAA83992.1 hypothetical protein BOX15_Mlig025869g2 [Macrostomum lignano]